MHTDFSRGEVNVLEITDMESYHIQHLRVITLTPTLSMQRACSYYWGGD